MTQRPRVLDLFSGGGGSSYGARAAGCEIVAGVDAWSMAARTFGRNFPGASAFNYALDGDRVDPRVKGLGRIDLLLASPECTNHSCARGSRPPSEASRMTAWQVIHHARELAPKWIVVENVIQMRAWDRFREFERELIGLGYNIWPQVIDASDHGVPQSRRRLFLVCSREDKPFAMRPTKVVAKKTARGILDPTGTWPVKPLFREGRAAATLERAERAMAAVGKREPFLLVYYGSDAAGGWQPLDRPLRTLTTLDRFALVQPTPRGHTMRMLQVPELQRAMGYDNNYTLDLGTRREHVKLLGNGVCPPVMTDIVEALLRPTRSASTRVEAEGQVRLVSSA